MATIGLIVEGVYDEEAISVLIQRIKGQAERPVCRVCGGSVRGKFLRRLRELKYQNPEKVLVVRDADGKNPDEVIGELESEIPNQIIFNKGGLEALQKVIDLLKKR